MSKRPNMFLSEAEYLEIERKAEYKSDYYAGEMFAMSGGSPKHCWIVANLVIAFGVQLRGKPCRVSATDLRLRVTAAGLYTYPDLIVVCGEPQFADDQKDTLLNPKLIVEVLSESTRGIDQR